MDEGAPAYLPSINIEGSIPPLRVMVTPRGIHVQGTQHVASKFLMDVASMTPFPSHAHYNYL